MAALSEDRFTDAHVQAVAKARRDGIDALDDEERARYDEIAEIVGRSMASTTPEQRRAYSEAMDAYDRMSSADQLRTRTGRLNSCSRSSLYSTSRAQPDPARRVERRALLVEPDRLRNVPLGGDV